MSTVGPRLNDSGLRYRRREFMLPFPSTEPAVEAIDADLSILLSIRSLQYATAIVHSNGRDICELDRLCFQLQAWNFGMRLQLLGRLQGALKRRVQFQFSIGSLLRIGLRVWHESGEKRPDRDNTGIQGHTCRIARGEFDAAFGLNRCLLHVGGKTKFSVLPVRVEGLRVYAFEAFTAHLEVRGSGICGRLVGIIERPLRKASAVI